MSEQRSSSSLSTHPPFGPSSQPFLGLSVLLAGFDSSTMMTTVQSRLSLSLAVSAVTVTATVTVTVEPTHSHRVCTPVRHTHGGTVDDPSPLPCARRHRAFFIALSHLISSHLSSSFVVGSLFAVFSPWNSTESRSHCCGGLHLFSSPVFPSIRPSRHTRTATAHTHRNAETRCLTSTSPSRPAPHQNRLPTLSRLLAQSVENTSLLLQTAPPTNATASKPTTAPTPNTNHANTPFFLSPHPYTCVEAKAMGFTVRRTQLAPSFDNIRSRTTHYSPDNLPLHLYSIPLDVLYSSFSPPPPSAPRNNPPRRLAEVRNPPLKGWAYQWTPALADTLGRRKLAIRVHSP